MINTGDLFETNECGFIEVVEYLGCYEIKVRFINTGFEVMTRSGNIRSGKIRDYLMPSVHGVGFIGKKVRGITGLNSYKVWAGMLARCYSDSFKLSNPTYKDCFACEEWHCYINFKDWFDKNYIDGHDLDKDILVRGNKKYSPETCSFVSKELNRSYAVAKRWKVTKPNGEEIVLWNLYKFCKDNNLNSSCLFLVAKGERNHHKGYKCERV